MSLTTTPSTNSFSKDPTEELIKSKDDELIDSIKIMYDVLPAIVSLFKTFHLLQEASSITDTRPLLKEFKSHTIIFCKFLKMIGDQTLDEQKKLQKKIATENLKNEDCAAHINIIDCMINGSLNPSIRTINELNGKILETLKHFPEDDPEKSQSHKDGVFALKIARKELQYIPETLFKIKSLVRIPKKGWPADDCLYLSKVIYNIYKNNHWTCLTLLRRVELLLAESLSN